MPILGKEDPVVRNVVSTDDKGTTLDVVHLHTPPNPKLETKTIYVTTTASATVSKKKQKEPKEESAMSSLFSFFDLGGLLGGGDNKDSESSEENDSVEQNNLAGVRENFRKVRQVDESKPHFKRKERTVSV